MKARLHIVFLALFTLAIGILAMRSPHGPKRTYNNIFQAIEANDEDAVASILKAGVDPNIRQPQTGMTPLHYSLSLYKEKTPCTSQPSTCIGIVEIENAPIIEMLLKHGADPNAIYGGGRTPLSLAINHNSYETIPLLHKYGARDDPKPLAKK